VPTVSRISISPVKGLALVHPEQVQLDRTGVLENRRFHIVDTDGRRYNQLRNGGLVRIRQKYDAPHEQLALTFPDGSVAEGEVALGRTSAPAGAVGGRRPRRSPARPRLADLARLARGAGS
jgi:uncharacterized protein YcbX